MKKKKQIYVEDTETKLAIFRQATVQSYRLTNRERLSDGLDVLANHSPAHERKSRVWPVICMARNENYRSRLLSLCKKVFSRVLERRLQPNVEPQDTQGESPPCPNLYAFRLAKTTLGVCLTSVDVLFGLGEKTTTTSLRKSRIQGTGIITMSHLVDMMCS